VRGTQAKGTSVHVLTELALRALLLVCFPRADERGHVAFELDAMNSDDL
jgi:hypothetical protein